MTEVLLLLIPLIAAAVSPTMVALVILLLISKNGLVKSLAFLAGKALCYAVWGFLFWSLVEKLSVSKNELALSFDTALIQVIIGGLLMIIAARSYFVEDDPEAPPPKWMTTIDDLGLGKLFAFGFLISIVQPRLVMLMLVGTAYISAAQLPWDQVIISMFVLILGMIWSQLVPLIVYVFMAEQADATLTSMNVWLTRNQHIVNAVILGLFGIVILVDGLSRIFSRGL